MTLTRIIYLNLLIKQSSNIIELRIFININIYIVLIIVLYKK